MKISELSSSQCVCVYVYVCICTNLMDQISRWVAGGFGGERWVGRRMGAAEREREKVRLDEDGGERERGRGRE